MRVPAFDSSATEDCVDRARALVLRHGRQATSFQITNPGIAFSFAPDGSAVAGWVDAPGFKVIAGAPVCEVDRTQAEIQRLIGESMDAGKKLCLFAAERWVLNHLPASMATSPVLLGAQPSWSPRSWESRFERRASLRGQLNRARNKSVAIAEWPVGRAQGNPELILCLEHWLATRGLPAMHFLVEPDTLDRLEGRRVFVARREGEIIGFLVISPIPMRHGWLVEQIVRGKGAVNGTSELMLDAAVRTLDKEGSDYVTLGLSALSQHAGLDYSMNPGWLRFVFAWVRAHGLRFYNFEGLDAFKAKFQPDIWEPVYAITNERRFSMTALYAISSAFSNGSPIPLVARALGRAVRTEYRWFVNWMLGRNRQS